MQKTTLMIQRILFSFFTLSHCLAFSQKNISGSYNNDRKMFIQKKQDFWIGEFKNGVARISKGGYYGIINESGRIVLPLIYDDIYIADEGLFAKGKTGTFAFSLDGSENCSTFFGAHATKDSYREYPVYKALNFDYYGKPYSEGLFMARQNYNNETNKYQLTYFDSSGNIKITTDRYDNGQPFFNGLAAVSRFKYWGFIDKNGKEVIAPAYDYPTVFREGVANISRNGKYGLIDTRENIIIPFEYDLISPAFQGMVSVKKNNAFGLFDTKGKMIFDFVFDHATIFENGYAYVKKDNQWFSVNAKRETSEYHQLSYEEGYRFMNYNGNKVYEDKSGTVIFKNTFEAGSFAEGLSIIKSNGKYGFIDRLGTVIIPPTYDRAENFKDGYARVQTSGSSFYIDKKGNTADPVKSSAFSANIKGVTVSRTADGKYSLSDCMTKKIIEQDMDDVSVYGNFILVSKNKKRGIFDFKGNVLLKIVYDELIPKKNKITAKSGNRIDIFGSSCNIEKTFTLSSGDFRIYDEKKSDHAVIIEQDGKTGFINSTGNKMLSPRFDSVSFLEKSGIFLAKYTAENYLVDIVKNTATLFTWKDYSEFSKGILKISKNGKNQGLVNSENQVVLPAEYEILPLRNNTAVIISNNLYGMIDGEGKIILEPKYQKISVNDGSYMDGDDELILVKLNNKTGFADRKGNMKINFQYEDGIPFNNRLAPVKMDGKWGYIDKYNRLVIKNSYDEAWPFIDSYQARAKTGDQYIIIDRSGNKIRNADR